MMKSPHTLPPSSPLQKMKNPFIRRGSRRIRSPISFRARATTRASLTVVMICALLFVWNELRCLHYGCISRTGFYGGDGSDGEGGGYVGGGATIPKVQAQDVGKEEGEGNIGMGKGGERIKTTTAGATGAWWWKPKIGPWVDGGEGSIEEDGKEENQEKFAEGAGTLVMTEQLKAAMDEADPEAGIEQKERTLKDVLEKEKKIYLDGKLATAPSSSPFSSLSPASTPSPLANAATETTSPTLIPSPIQTLPTLPVTQTAMQKEPEEFSWEGREDDPPPMNELETQMRKASSQLQATWQQSEGQEDPVRLSRSSKAETKSSLKAGVDQMKLGVMDMGVLGGAKT